MKTSLKLIGGEKIASPKSDKTRPTTLMVREAIFNILNKNVENSYWLDLFSGSGSISCEAYNHGAKKIVAIEKNRIIAQLCKKNIFSLRDIQSRGNDIEVNCRDVFSWIEEYRIKNITQKSKFKKQPFDFIYIDPPYKSNFNELLLNKLFNSYIIKKSTLIIYEHSKEEQIKVDEKYKITDVRSYGQTKLTFLIKI